jgi:16S rRNA (uracil1498-N3)-methyltransferase
MRTVRVYSEAPLTGESTVSLSDEAAHHVTRVLRMRSGDTLVLFDGNGQEYAGTIIAADKKTTTVELGPAQQSDTEPFLQITLWHGICRGGRMDYVVQKATELGVSVIQPVFTTRGIVKLDGNRTTKRVEHWRKVTIAAAEQSGRVRLPEIREPVTLTAALTELPADPTRLMLDPQGTTGIDTLSTVDSLTVLTGPEGGFTDEEKAAAQAAGFALIKLGTRILRSETAPLAALAVLQYQLGDLRQTDG